MVSNPVAPPILHERLDYIFNIFNHESDGYTFQIHLNLSDISIIFINCVKKYIWKTLESFLKNLNFFLALLAMFFNIYFLILFKILHTDYINLSV